MYCYDYVVDHKEKFLRPEGITFEEGDAKVPLQNLFAHTARRIFHIPDNKDLIDQVRRYKELNEGALTITFYAGIGPDGSSGKVTRMIG